MTTREPECGALKRRGAEYVGQWLSGKSEQEELEFWRKRTERLRSLQNNIEKVALRNSLLKDKKS